MRLQLGFLRKIPAHVTGEVLAMESLTYLHLALVHQQAETPLKTSNNLGASWNSEVWDEIFSEPEEEENREQFTRNSRHRCGV